MAIVWMCDHCKKFDVRTIKVRMCEESPHDGDLEWVEKDLCVDCLKEYKRIIVEK